MFKAIRHLGTATIASLMLTTWAPAVVKLPNVISDHMVLQRDTSVPIWGTAAPDEKITVKFRDQQKTTEAAKDGIVDRQARCPQGRRAG